MQLSSEQRSSINNPSSLVNLVAQANDYFRARNVPSAVPLVDLPNDIPDMEGRPVPNFVPSSNAGPRAGVPIGSSQLPNFVNVNVSKQVSEYEKMYYAESTKTKTLEEEIRNIKELAAKIQADKEAVKSSYEEFIARLRAENSELKKSEDKLIQVTNLKKNLELELERMAQELNTFKNNSSRDQVVDELKKIIQRLKDEKIELRRQLEQHKTQITELVTSITTIRESNEGEIASLRSQLQVIQDKYSRLQSEYERERNKPIPIPDDPNLKQLLQEKIATIESLQMRIRFLDEELKKKAVCYICPEKDIQITQLNTRIRELESRPKEIQKEVIIQPPEIRREIVYQQPEVRTVSYTRAPVTTYSTTTIAPPIVSRVVAAPSVCTCKSKVTSYNARCPLCGCENPPYSNFSDTTYLGSRSMVKTGETLIAPTTTKVITSSPSFKTYETTRTYSPSFTTRTTLPYNSSYTSSFVNPTTTITSPTTTYSTPTTITSTASTAPQTVVSSTISRSPMRYSMRNVEPTRKVVENVTEFKSNNITYRNMPVPEPRINRIDASPNILVNAGNSPHTDFYERGKDYSDPVTAEGSRTGSEIFKQGFSFGLR